MNGIRPLQIKNTINRSIYPLLGNTTVHNRLHNRVPHRIQRHNVITAELPGKENNINTRLYRFNSRIVYPVLLNNCLLYTSPSPRD